MKRVIAILMLLVAVTAFASPDAVRKSEQDGKQLVTTWTRDGKIIFILTSYKSKHPRKNITRQEIMFNETRVMHIVDFGGKRSYMTEPESLVHTGVDVDKKGNITGAVMFDRNDDIIEAVTAKNSVLEPVSGAELDRIRSLTSDVSELFDRKNMEKKSPDELTEQAGGIIRKHKRDEWHNK